MNKLIIVTGISGTGKTTLCNYVQKKLEDVTVISLDKVKENIFDTVGFHDREQKKSLENVIESVFIDLLKECMRRQDKIIIIEYPFSTRWEEVFKASINMYNYDALTIKLYNDSFENIWKRIEKRDLSEERHVSHEILEYNPLKKEEYKKKVMNRKIVEEEYATERPTTINVGNAVKINNINKDDMIKILNIIKEFVAS